jgi:hypothetical protein
MEHQFVAPGGVGVVIAWLDEVNNRNPNPWVWSALDDNHRLCVAQAWLYGDGNGQEPDRDEIAASLAQPDSKNELFPALFREITTDYRDIYKDIDGSPALLEHTDLVGVDLELVVVTSNEYAGEYPAGARIPVNSFITRLVGGSWRIAARGRRLPIPGWPPTETDPVASLPTAEED